MKEIPSKEQSLKIKGYAAEKFLRVNHMLRYTNDLISSRHVTFNVPESDAYHMYFCSRGSLTIKTNSTVYCMNENDLLIYKPHGKHELDSPYMASYMHCIFSGYSVKEILKDLDFEKNTIYHVAPNYKSGDHFMFFNKQIEYVWAEFRNQKEYSELSCTCMLVEFLSLYSRNRVKENTSPYVKYIQSALSYIADNREKTLNVENLIKDSHLSKSQFYRLFKDYTGTSPLRFQQSCRLSAAADYLVLYDMKIQDICKFIGIDDALYFSKLFKKEFGVSPTKYAKLHKAHSHIQDDNI